MNVGSHLFKNNNSIPKKTFLGFFKNLSLISKKIDQEIYGSKIESVFGSLFMKLTIWYDVEFKLDFYFFQNNVLTEKIIETFEILEYLTDK